MKSFTDVRNDQTTDEIWLLEHPPVFTLGQAGKEEHILDAGTIEVVRTDRGGTGHVPRSRTTRWLYVMGYKAQRDWHKKAGLWYGECAHQKCWMNWVSGP